MKLTSIVIAALTLAALSSAPAAAQNARTFVSGHGSDANFCTLYSPCRNFARALIMTKAGGEITVLDPAGYGTLIIDKAISIINDGVGEAGISLNAAGDGITINAGAADAVILRGLTVNGNGVGTRGIMFNTGASLSVENCVVRGFTGHGIYLFATGTSDFSVSNTIVSDNLQHGIFVAPVGSGAITAVFNRIETKRNTLGGLAVTGMVSTGTVRVSVHDSIVAHNANVGITAQSASGKAPTTVMLFHSVVANNNFGVDASGANAVLRVAQSMITGNAVGWSGSIQSYGDNYIDGNTVGETVPPNIVRK